MARMSLKEFMSHEALSSRFIEITNDPAFITGMSALEPLYLPQRTEGGKDRDYGYLYGCVTGAFHLRMLLGSVAGMRSQISQAKQLNNESSDYSYEDVLKKEYGYDREQINAAVADARRTGAIE